jgi:hypothetical protein
MFGEAKFRCVQGAPAGGMHLPDRRTDKIPSFLLIALNIVAFCFFKICAAFESRERKRWYMWPAELMLDLNALLGFAS